MKLGTQVGLGHIVRWGSSSPSPKGGRAPSQFSAHFYCGQTAGCIKMPLGVEVGLGPGDFVLDGDPAPPSPEGGTAPSKFSAHVYCDQTTGWMKLVLGMGVGLSSGDFVLDGDRPSPLPPKEGGAPSTILGPFLLWPNGCMHQNATWYRARPRPRRLFTARAIALQALY